MRKRMLVCDDDARIQKLIRDILYEKPVAITMTDTLGSLLYEAESGMRYDLIVLDGKLVEGTTMPFCKSLHDSEYPHLEGATIVLMSDDDLLVKAQARLLHAHTAGRWTVRRARKATLREDLLRFFSSSL